MLAVSGSDKLPGELLKSGSEILAKPIANIINRALTEQQTLPQLGHGVFILLSKPVKPVGAMTSLRPIMLLNVLRKMLSLLVFACIADTFEPFLSLKDKADFNMAAALQMSYKSIVS